jgi:hypothetical protein
MFEKLGSYLFKNKICPNKEQVVCSLQGVLAQAKNGDELFCKEKFHAANGKVPTCSQGALISFGRGGGGRPICPFSQGEG